MDKATHRSGAHRVLLGHVAVLKAALEPFAKAADVVVRDKEGIVTPNDGDVFPASVICWGHLRAARQALASLEERDRG